MDRKVATPPPALTPFVASIGYYEGDFAHASERVLPTGSAQLVINLDDDVLGTGEPDRIGGAGLVGTASGPTDVDPSQQRATIFVAFRPGGSYPFLPFPAAAATDQVVELGELWGDDGRVLRERMLDAPTVQSRLSLMTDTLLTRAHAREPDPPLRYACQALHRGVPVKDVVDELGISWKRLIRMFRERVGLPPKPYARIRRLQRVLAAIPDDRPVNWAMLAARYGYADQPHLVHDFRELTGLTPSRYRARSRGEPNHVVLS